MVRGSREAIAEDAIETAGTLRGPPFGFHLGGGGTFKFEHFKTGAGSRR
jgi:hypothetical protein